MKHLVLTLWFVLLMSSPTLAGVEYVTEEVCHNMSGCRIVIETGECPECVIERREVAHTHEEKPVVKNRPVVKTTPKRKVKNKTPTKRKIELEIYFNKNVSLKREK